MAHPAQRLALAAVMLLTVLVLYSARRHIARGLDRFTIEKTALVTSKVDGASYRVHLRHAESQRAADSLATLNAHIIRLMRALRDRYLRSEAGAAYPERQAMTRRFLARYNPDNLTENSPRDPTGDTAYTLDKGAVVAICLRERRGRNATEAEALHEMSILLFVTFHEMTHIAVDVQDHPPDFWRAFRFLLQEAADADILKPVDYKQGPVQYCGVPVDYNPLFDRAVGLLR